jgi:hypothetical protein
MPLLFGFAFMLIVEQLSSSHAHHEPHHARRPSQQHHALGITSPDSIFDVELAGLDDGTDGVPASHVRRASASSVSAMKTNFESDTPSAYPITIGLVLHGLADGLALGMSVLSNEESSSHPYALSLVVFMALAVHKGAYTVLRREPRVFSPFIVPSLTRSYLPSVRPCSSHRPRVHSLPHVDFSLARGVQKTSDFIQRIDPSRSYRILRILLIYRIKKRGRRWHRLAHICEIFSLWKGVRGVAQRITFNN